MKKCATILTILTVIAMCLALLPITAGAEVPEDVISGTCGENVVWTLTQSGVLTISGTGDMTSHPWTEEHAGDIREVVIEEGVTEICYDAFINCANMTTITIPNSMEYINGAFTGCSSLTDAYYYGIQLDWEYGTLLPAGGMMDAWDPLLHANIHFAETEQAGDDYTVALQIVSIAGTGEEIVPEDGIYRADAHEEVDLTFFAPDISGYSKTYRINPGAAWWDGPIVPDEQGIAGYRTSMPNHDLYFYPYSLLAVYVPDDRTLPILVTCEYDFYLDGISKGDTGISIDIPGYYQKKANPGDGDGYSFTIHIPEEVLGKITSWQAYAYTRTGGQYKRFFHDRNTPETACLSYTIPDAEMEAGMECTVCVDALAVGYDSYYFTENFTVFDAPGNDIQLMLMDGSEPASAPLQTGKVYTLQASASRPDIRALRIWNGAEWVYTDSASAEIEVLFGYAGDFLLTAEGTTDSGDPGEAAWTCSGESLAVNVISGNQFTDDLNITIAKQTYKLGEDVDVTITQPAGAAFFDVVVYRSTWSMFGEEEIIYYSARSEATNDDTLTVLIPTDELDLGMYYDVRVRCYGTGYEAIEAESSFRIDRTMGVPEITMDAPTIYQKASNPAEGDGYPITIDVPEEAFANLSSWTLNVRNEDYEIIFTLSSNNGDAFANTLIIPDSILTTGEKYSFNLSLTFEKYSEFSSDSSFRVYEAPETIPSITLRVVDAEDGSVPDAILTNRRYRIIVEADPSIKAVILWQDTRMFNYNPGNTLVYTDNWQTAQRVQFIAYGATEVPWEEGEAYWFYDWKNDIDWTACSEILTLDVTTPYGQLDKPTVILDNPAVYNRGDLISLRINQVTGGKNYYFSIRKADNPHYVYSDSYCVSVNEEDPILFTIPTDHMTAGQYLIELSVEGEGYESVFSQTRFTITDNGTVPAAVIRFFPDNPCAADTIKFYIYAPEHQNQQLEMRIRRESETYDFLYYYLSISEDGDGTIEHERFSPGNYVVSLYDEETGDLITTTQLTVSTIDPSTLLTLDLPEDLERIEDEAFMNGAFEAVVIPDGCTYVGHRAFANCLNLVYVSYPQGTVIEDDAFEDCNVPVWAER